jgi:hypothetical protein
LELVDLETFPIWEYATDEESVPGRDETWVRPLKANAIPVNSYSLSVAAEFTLANGTRMQGMVNTNYQAVLEIGYASLMTNHDFHLVPRGDEAFAKSERATLIRELGLHEKLIFPIRYRLLALAENESKLRTGLYD